MNISHLIRVFQSTGQGWRRGVARVRAALGAMVVMSLVGCASSVSVVETWEGNPAAASNAATLEAPGEIRVTRVNGRAMTNFLMDDLALDYALLPGENEVVFVYKTIWAKSGVVRNGESKVHVIESEPQCQWRNSGRNRRNTRPRHTPYPASAHHRPEAAGHLAGR